VVDCSDTDDIVVHIPVELNASAVALGGVFLRAVLAHQGAVAARGSAAEAEEVEFVLTLTRVGGAGTEEVGSDHCLRPGRVDETGGRRATD
jgi:hypothetical protein